MLEIGLSLPDGPRSAMSTDPSKLARVLYGVLLLHTFIWLAVNCLLFFINLITTMLMPPWFLFPLLGWGLGVAIHAAVTVGIAGTRQLGLLLPQLEPLPPFASALSAPLAELARQPGADQSLLGALPQ
mmetsp:Transcript_102065/g.259389  ORF Transcript_102065/g.259389 Transcript_102065/m.259389 type:complete len:128 (-) Transcript_102065:308-691(-)